MHYFVQQISIVLFCCSLLACNNHFNTPKDKTPKRHLKNYSIDNDSAINLIQSGDIVLRKGRDQLSQIFASLNTHNQQYSHCGLAQRTDSGLYIYHIILSEHNPEGKVMFESVNSFINPTINAKWAIVRYQLNSQQISDLLQQVKNYAADGLTFDKQFDLATDDKMYCTEMLYKALVSTTKDTLLIAPTISISGRKYIAVDNLFGNNSSKTIGEITYK